MNVSALDPALWSRVRWWAAFAFVMSAQVCLIFWLSDRAPVVPRQPDLHTSFYLVGSAPPGSPVSEWLSIEDPTLLVLPNPNSFSGPAWMTPQPLEHESQDWAEPERWLALPATDLGATFTEFVHTNIVGPRFLADKPAPRLSEVAAQSAPTPDKSTFRIEGGLAKRGLLARPEVAAITNSDILTSTEVQVGVDELGFVFSAVPLKGSGSKNADQIALDQAKTLRFRPLARRSGRSPGEPLSLTWGEIIFQWQTVEVPATNGPAAQTPP